MRAKLFDVKKLSKKNSLREIVKDELAKRTFLLMLLISLMFQFSKSLKKVDILTTDMQISFHNFKKFLIFDFTF